MMDFNAFEDEIRAAEQNIAFNRMELDAAIHNATAQARNAAKNALTSPLFLVGALGFGLAAGHVIFKRKAPPPTTAANVAKKSMWAIAATTAFSLVQAHFGGPVGMARWVLTKIAERRYAAQHGNAQQTLNY